MKPRGFQWIAVVCMIALTAGAVVQSWPVGPRLRAEDRDGDGRPDVWRIYDQQGQLVEIDLDTNRDGRPDVQEHYRHGVLVRRESDRNFNGQIDLVEEFGSPGVEPVRELIDVDYDGSADLLILFQNGRPVAVKEAPKAVSAPAQTRAAAPARGVLIALLNPFANDNTFQGVVPTADPWVGLAPSTAVAAAAPSVDAPASVSVSIVAAPDRLSSIRPTVRSPRGPPLA